MVHACEFIASKSQNQPLDPQSLGSMDGSVFSFRFLKSGPFKNIQMGSIQTDTWENDDYFFSTRLNVACIIRNEYFLILGHHTLLNEETRCPTMTK